MGRNYSLIGVDGNAFSVMGYVKRAMRKEGKSEEQVLFYIHEATAGTYEDLLSISQMEIEELNDEPTRTV